MIRKNTSLVFEYVQLSPQHGLRGEGVKGVGGAVYLKNHNKAENLFFTKRRMPFPLLPKQLPSNLRNVAILLSFYFLCYHLIFDAPFSYYVSQEAVSQFVSTIAVHSGLSQYIFIRYLLYLRDLYHSP